MEETLQDDFYDNKKSILTTKIEKMIDIWILKAGRKI